MTSNGDIRNLRLCLIILCGYSSYFMEVSGKQRGSKLYIGGSEQNVWVPTEQFFEGWGQDLMDCGCYLKTQVSTDLQNICARHMPYDYIIYSIITKNKI